MGDCFAVARTGARFGLGSEAPEDPSLQCWRDRRSKWGCFWVPEYGGRTICRTWNLSVRRSLQFDASTRDFGRDDWTLTHNALFEWNMRSRVLIFWKPSRLNQLRTTNPVVKVGRSFVNVSFNWMYPPASTVQ